MSESSTPKCVGLVRPDVSESNLDRHISELRRYATQSGFQYVYTVRPPDNHPDPVGYALDIATSAAATVLVVFDLATVDHTPSRVCDQLDLHTVSPPQRWTKILTPDIGQADEYADDGPAGSPAEYQPIPRIPDSCQSNFPHFQSVLDDLDKIIDCSVNASTFAAGIDHSTWD